MRPPTPTVARYLRRLDHRELAALLADVYRELGHDVTVEGDLVVADRAGSRTVLLAVAGRARSAPLPPDVSVVVTTGRGGGPAGTAADRLDADLRTVDDLAEMLFYAVDREVTVRLCERHLGVPPAEMVPPPTRRVRSHLAAVSSLSVAALVVGAALVAALALGVAVPSDPTPPSATGTPTPGETPGPPDPPSRPPGVGPDGTVDVVRVAIAHHRALRTNAFRLERTYSGPATRRGSVVGNYTSQYRLVVVGERTRFARWRTVRCDGPGTARERYFDGRGLYEVHYNGTAVSAGPIPLGDNAIYPRAAETSASVVQRYLDTSNVTARPAGGSRGRYTVLARGAPEDLLVPPATDYTARATVAPSGVVEELDVAFRPRNGSRPVRTSLRHSLSVPAAPAVPPWYRDLPNATRGNGTVGADATGVPFSEQVDTVTRRRAAHCRD
jgi:hypothetical protein